MPFRDSRFSPRHRQRGAVAVLAAVTIVALLISSLLVIEVGRVYYAERSLQKMASLAALDAARLVSGCGDPATQAALDSSVAASLARNGDPAILTSTTVEAGIVETNVSSLRELSVTDMDDARAVRVTLKRPLPSLLTPLLTAVGGTMTASATATQEALGGLSVGSGLLSISSADSALLNPLLSGLLGGSVNLTAVDYSGLAGVNVSLEQLATAIGVDVQDLSDPLALSTQTPVLSETLNGLAGALGGTASGTVTGLLTQLAGSASNQDVPLGTILNPIADVAADVPFVNLLDLILAMGQAAQADYGGVTPIDLPVGISIPSTLTVRAFVKVLEPPQLSGLGRPGQTEASTAQIRIMLRIEAGSLITALQGTLDGVMDGVFGLLNLGTSIDSDIDPVPPPLNIGVDIEVAKATAYLDALQCPRADLNNGEPIAELSASPAIASVEIGRFNGSASTAPDLDPQDNWPIVNVTVDATNACVGLKIGNNCLGLPLNLGSTDLTLSLGLTALGAGGGGGRQSLPSEVTQFERIENLPDTAAPAWMAEGVPPDAPVAANPQTVGSDVDVGLDLELESQQTGSGLVGILGGLVNTVISAVAAAVQPLLDVVNGLADTLINPLLDVLGIQLGAATVTMLGVTVDQPRIVTTELPATAAP